MLMKSIICTFLLMMSTKVKFGGIGVAVADSPEGPFKDALGKPLINEIIKRGHNLSISLYSRMMMAVITCIMEAGGIAIW